MKTVDIYAFRHGETDYNAQQRFQGHLDIPLNEIGREQARGLAGLLLGKGIEKIASSNLSRALETAQIVASLLHVPIETHPDLREINCGLAEGQLRENALKEYGEDFWRDWRSVDDKYMDMRWKEGESKRECLTRAQKVMHALAEDPGNSCIGLSVHGAVLRYLVHAIIGYREEPISVPNCAVFLLRYHREEGRWEFDDFLNVARLDA